MIVKADSIELIRYRNEVAKSLVETDYHGTIEVKNTMFLTIDMQHEIILEELGIQLTKSNNRVTRVTIL